MKKGYYLFPIILVLAAFIGIIGSICLFAYLFPDQTIINRYEEALRNQRLTNYYCCNGKNITGVYCTDTYYDQEKNICILTMCPCVYPINYDECHAENCEYAPKYKRIIKECNSDGICSYYGELE